MNNDDCLRTPVVSRCVTWGSGLTVLAVTLLSIVKFFRVRPSMNLLFFYSPSSIFSPFVSRTTCICYETRNWTVSATYYVFSSKTVRQETACNASLYGFAYVTLLLAYALLSAVFLAFCYAAVALSEHRLDQIIDKFTLSSIVSWYATFCIHCVIFYSCPVLYFYTLVVWSLINPNQKISKTVESLFFTILHEYR